MAASELTESRAIPVAPQDAFDRLLALPLPSLFARRFGPISPVREVRDAPPSWDSTGQSRLVVLTDGSTAREELTSVDPPHGYGYTLGELTGPLKLLVERVEGRWGVEPVGTGARITWAWTVHPNGPVGELAMPLFEWLWHGYARQALEELERLLLES